MTDPGRHQTGTTAVTYRIDRPCPHPDGETCQIAEMDHYGMRTGELLCYTHAEVVGEITEP
jgi:hypothetical protein